MVSVKVIDGKNYVYEQVVGTYDRDSYDINDLMSEVDTAKEVGYIKLQLEVYRPDSYEDYQRIGLFGYRLEMESEAKKRTEQEAKDNKRREDFQRKEYEALKAKFEGK